MMGMQWGGYQYPWGSAHVLAPLILGVVLLIAFFIWESKLAKNRTYTDGCKPRRWRDTAL